MEFVTNGCNMPTTSGGAEGLGTCRAPGISNTNTTIRQFKLATLIPVGRGQASDLFDSPNPFLEPMEANGLSSRKTVQQTIEWRTPKSSP
uniref:Uncharacterized protein n=1 Tax=Cannabis sativa TaxID=3483 RepID=A0A803NY17_CANSA